jgi:hypothetical protein
MNKKLKSDCKNKSTNTSKMKNHLSPLTIEKKKGHAIWHLESSSLAEARNFSRVKSVNGVRLITGSLMTIQMDLRESQCFFADFSEREINNCDKTYLYSSKKEQLPMLKDTL